LNITVFNNNISPQQLKNIMVWCENCLGPGIEIHNSELGKDHRWGLRTDLGNMHTLFIRDDQDYFLFKLTWGELNRNPRNYIGHI